MKKVTIALALPAAAAGVLAGGMIGFQRKAAAKVQGLFAQADPEPEKIITEQMLEPLPAPVRRYLRLAGVVGRPMVRTVYLRQEGQIRPAVDRPWLEMKAEQWFTVSPPSFVWYATSRIAGLPLVQVRDSYGEGAGQMLVTAAGLYPMTDSRGPEMDQGSLLRYLGEMIWFPSAFLRDNVSWEAVDEHSARVTLTDRGLSVSGVFTFDEEGRVTNFLGERYRDTAAGPQLTPWSAPTAAYGRRAGLEMPVRGTIIWHLEEGELPYYEWTLTDLIYDVPAP